MKHITTIFFLLACLPLVCGCATPGTQATAMPALSPSPTVSPIDAAAGELHWFRYSAFLYHGSKNIYFDPVSLSGDLPPADLILITHAHSETWSLKDIQKIIGPGTTLVLSPSANAKYETFKEQIGAPAVVLAEGESAEVHGVKITAMHVRENPQHLAAAGMTGFLVEIDGVRIYDASDTIFFPELADIPCDIALYPIFNQEDVEQSVGVLQAQIVIFERTTLNDAEDTVAHYNGNGLETQFMVPAHGAYQP